ncbi:predicted protein [Sparassis crispa]|uniref:Inner centromere protein ARK-binding domain-containing protein n=1 Tax=Sparassis crispa TaxID=139825 RepID=A0A401GP46_9APHY|nr:predicted protein [Sparassis crispa]GBE83919.1 predicted protein [Sparassis crispa]
MVMDNSDPGAAGVIAWCNMIRFNMARDPGRQFLEEQIQNGFDFLDSYLENVLSGPKTESVTELLKTPGRKKDAPRTRAATAAAMKANAVFSVSLEEDDASQENRAPVNSFHRTLLQAKEQNDAISSMATSKESVHHQSREISNAMDATEPLKGKVQKVLAITNSHSSETAEMEREDHVMAPQVNVSSPPLHASEPQVDAFVVDDYMEPSIVPKELSVIAEDDEQRSRLSLPAPSQEVIDVSPPVAAMSGLQEKPQPVDDMVTNEIQVQLPTEIADHTPDDDFASTSAQTFHSIPLDSPRVLSAVIEYSTAPLPPMPRGDVQDDAHASATPLPIVPSASTEDATSDPTQSGDLVVPIRDDAQTSGQVLNRKPSLSQFTGLSAPSPLRNSRGITREPSMGPGPGTTPAPSTGVVVGKRSSWLVKAREAKALEVTSKRVSTLGAGTSTMMTGTKRKSVEMLGPSIPSLASNLNVKSSEDGERLPKVLKLAEPIEDTSIQKGKGNESAEHNAVEKPSLIAAKGERETPPLRAPPSPTRTTRTLHAAQSTEDITVPLRSAEEEGVLDRFKRTVEGFGARAGKNAGKSLGENAAAALAEARAAAEAKVAQRHKIEGEDSIIMTEESRMAVVPVEEPSVPKVISSAPPSATAPKESDKRLSISDLVSSADDEVRKQHLAPAAQLVPQPSTVNNVADSSMSTTPPNSPPPQKPIFTAPPPPVFSKPVPHPVFALPTAVSHNKPAAATGPSKDFLFKLPSSSLFSLPAASLGVPPTFSAPHALSAQSSKASIFSDVIFDKEDSVPAWMTSTQDTDYEEYRSQSQQKAATQTDELDDDDSWHVDEKFTSNQMWTPFGFASADKDDTWSTIPSRSTSQKGGDTGPLQTQNLTRALEQVQEAFSEHEPEPAQTVPEVDDDGYNAEAEELADMAMEIDEMDVPEPETDLEDIILAGKSTVGLVKPKHDPLRARSQSQQSSTSASSSQSQMGFFGNASKFVSSMLGGSKKPKPEPVKSLQLAAVAAKKQQEENEKKTARLKEMENRRQLAQQRKAEEDKARAIEEDRKFKVETERRKREREEHTDKRPLRSTMKKGEEDNTKKRKLGDTEKKPDSKKPPSKERKDALPVRTGKFPSAAAPGTSTKTMKSALKQHPPHTQDSSAAASSSTAKPPKNLKTAGSSSNLKASAKGKAPATQKDDDLGGQQPSQVVQSQMANRAKTQMQAAQPPPLSSNDIELPEIHSEYSDSEDENRPRTFDPPEWAQSPELRHALQQQSTLNPDDIFGKIGPLRMEEIFRTRQSRFRARTSSANWTGTDQLTQQEEEEYARRMGFKETQ